MSGAFLAMEVAVLTSGGERSHVRGQAAYEGDPGVIIRQVGPEAVDVEPEARGAVRERGRILGYPPERTAHVVHVEAGAGPGLFGSAANQHVDHVVVEPVER